MMRGQKEPLRPLTVAEHQMVERVSKASSERVDTVRRARALQVVARGGEPLPKRRRRLDSRV